MRLSRSGYELIGEDDALTVPLDGSMEYTKPAAAKALPSNNLNDMCPEYFRIAS